MENQRTPNIDTIGRDVKEYAELRLELFKIEIVEKSSLALAKGIKYIAIGIFLASFMGFAMLGIAFWLSEVLHSYTRGFLATSLIFLIIAALLALTARWWMASIRNSFINSFFDGRED